MQSLKSRKKERELKTPTDYRPASNLEDRSDRTTMNANKLLTTITIALLFSALVVYMTHPSEAKTKRRYCGDILSPFPEAPRLCYDSMDECQFAKENLVSQGTILSECYKAKDIK